MTITVVKWVNSDYESPKDIGCMGGFFHRGMRWRDYIDSFNDDIRPHLEALRGEILKNGIRYGGFWHQSDVEGTPLFSDGAIGSFSFRAWGDLMAAIWSTAENKDYSYIKFAWHDDDDYES